MNGLLGGMVERQRKAKETEVALKAKYERSLEELRNENMEIKGNLDNLKIQLQETNA